MAGTPDDDLRLVPGGPCVDAGSNALVPADSFDVDGDGDTSEPLPFDGARLPRFVDDPSAPDTGQGGPAVTDMGSHESPGFYDADGSGTADALELCQPDIGHQGPGSMVLSVCGGDLLSAGADATLLLTGAPPSAPFLLFVSPTAEPTPVAGGVLVPFPPAAVIGPVLTGPSGSAAGAIPGGGGPPSVLFMQAATLNGAVVEFSNAIQGTHGT